MSKLIALVSGMGWHVQDLTRAARALGVAFEAVPFPRVVGRLGGGRERIEAGGIDLTRVGGVLVRMMPPGSLEQVVFRRDALHRLAASGVPVMNAPRAIETAMHKLHELGYDLQSVVSGFGSAPLPPIAADDMAAIGRTNDAILYGGQVTLWVQDSDDRLAEIGPRVPSAASRDFGQPFAAIFERYDRDFYKIDPLLFSPAQVTFMNLSSGRAHRFGQTRSDVLQNSFAS
jgi:hypothetical protein